MRSGLIRYNRVTPHHDASSMQGDILQQGLTLMLVGMGTVFVFLTALVIAMTLMSGISKRLQPEPVVSNEVSADEVAAITAAINRHRHR